MKTMPLNALIVLAAFLGGLFPMTFARAGDLQIFTGDWCNSDFNTRSITRAEIYLDGDKLKVHMWGRCHPTECDWGEATATAVPGDNNSILVQWNQGFVVRTQKLKLQEDGTLVLVGTSTYKDPARPIQRMECTFVNGLKHDWSDGGKK
jgi:hypothetical protein